MRSTWMIIKSLRIHLIVGAVISIPCGLFWGALANMEPGDPFFRNSFLVSAVLLCVGSAVVFAGQVPRRLSLYPFPVSPRQQAWIPMGLAAFFWLVGTLVYLVLISLGALAARVAVSVWMAQIMAPVYVLPLTALLCSLLQGALFYRLRPLSFFILMIMVSQMNPNFNREYLAWHQFGWPIILLLALLLFFAAPRVLAATDHSCLNINRNRGAEPQSKSSEYLSKPFPAVLFTETVGYIFIVMMFAIAAFVFARTVWLAYLHTSRIEWPFWTVLFAIIPASLVFAKMAFFDYLRVRASGFGPGASVVLLAMRITVVPAPLTRFFGVRSGNPIRCKKCGQRMFVWQPDCRHCGAGTVTRPDLWSGVSTDKETQSLDKPKKLIEMTVYGWAGFFGHLILVAYLVGAAVFSYNADFTSADVNISLGYMPQTVNRDQVIADIRKTLESESIPWLESVWPAEAGRGRYPRRYNIDLYVDTPDRIRFRFLCPRWECADIMAQELTEDMIKRLQYKYLLVPKPVDSHNALFLGVFGVPRLDRRVEWHPLDRTKIRAKD